ncbi:DciA family protein [Iodobacter sp.]|uniref:DciA family protein n=1 Tax=Iodobacter sp. TaxID=1915058 RepID=UPI0025D1258F|nr:DciA family protein [Iodobacter sp.]
MLKKTTLKQVGNDRQLASLMHQVDDLASVLAQVRGVLPPAMASHCLGVAWSGDTILIGVSGSAAASRVRQLAPQILAALQVGGWKATAILPKVQVGLQSTKAIRSKDLHLKAGACVAFSELSANLEDGPLREAITSLLNRHAPKDS